MNEQRLREALRNAPIDDAGARARALRVVRAAYAEREITRSRHAWRPALAIVACLAAIGIALAAAGTPGDAVARWVREVLGVGDKDARPALVRLPGGGRLLISSSAGAAVGSTGRGAGGQGDAVAGSAGAWVVSADGSRRHLGDYVGASWSAHGRFAVVWRGGELAAVEPGGRVRWSLARSAPITVARWAPVDGFRIAYLSGAVLRVVNGDGTGDHRHGPARAVPPAWRPDARHVLAYVDRGGRVRVVAVDSRHELWRTAPVASARELAWSPDGSRLLVATARELRVHARGGRLLARGALPAGLLADDVAWAPDGRHVALVRRDVAAARSEVVVGEPAAGSRPRVLFTGPGRFGRVAWSPTGRRLLVPWPEADQWLFLSPDAAGRTTAAGNIERQFTAGPGRRAFPDVVEWCCAR